MTNYTHEKEAAEAFTERYQRILEEISKVIIGQKATAELLLISIFCGGHALLVGVPGLAKTLFVQTLAEAMQLSFQRIQFTPDLMPSDILGSEVMDKEHRLRFAKGPIFAQIILADEINRTPPKTQAALLEAMQEQKVTIGGVDYPLERPFFVFATQNPIEQEGTYPLPEAQLDRFMFEIKLDYPSLEEEKRIVEANTSTKEVQVEKILSAEEIIYFQQLIRKVPTTENLIEYAVQLVHRTRPRHNSAGSIATEFLQWGAGPRASQFLVLAAKCHALIHGKFAPDIEDIQAIASAVLRHRIVRNFKAATEHLNEDAIIEKLL